MTENVEDCVLEDESTRPVLNTARLYVLLVPLQVRLDRLEGLAGLTHCATVEFV